MKAYRITIAEFVLDGLGEGEYPHVHLEPSNFITRAPGDCAARLLGRELARDVAIFGGKYTVWAEDDNLVDDGLVGGGWHEPSWLGPVAARVCADGRPHMLGIVDDIEERMAAWLVPADKVIAALRELNDGDGTEEQDRELAAYFLGARKTVAILTEVRKGDCDNGRPIRVALALPRIGTDGADEGEG